MFTIIAAHYKNIIGVRYEDGKMGLPWDRIPSDMEHFRNTTEGAFLIVGRVTYETLPDLPGRTLVLISQNPPSTSSDKNTDRKWVRNFNEALYLTQALDPQKPIFVIGGGKLYKDAILHPYCLGLDITEVDFVDDGVPLKGTPVAYFPKIPENYIVTDEKNLVDGKYILSRKKYTNQCNPKSDEIEYLKCLIDILKNGSEKMDRTNIGTLSLFGGVLKFRFQGLDNDYFTFPLLTTKKMFFKGIVEELLFFLRGDIDNDILNSKGIHIWDGNTSREFLDKRGLTNFEEGSLGKAYGFQWRYWGAEYKGKRHDYKSEGSGFDQISNIVHLLKTDPNSRRIVLSAWNVSDLDQMAIPPCHTLYVFNVQEGELYCHLTQRSGDMFLGVPFNIASAALLTFILAKCTGLKPGGLMLTIVDAHIYMNHIEQVHEQINRPPYYFPLLKITKDISTVEDIENLSFEDFSLTSYRSYPAIKADMAI